MRNILKVKVKVMGQLLLCSSRSGHHHELQICFANHSLACLWNGPSHVPDDTCLKWSSPITP